MNAEATRAVIACLWADRDLEQDNSVDSLAAHLENALTNYRDISDFRELKGKDLTGVDYRAVAAALIYSPLEVEDEAPALRLVG